MTKSIMDSEGLRGNTHARVLQLLAELMSGRTLNRHTAALRVEVNHEGAYRMLEALEGNVPGVRRRPGTRPAEFEFDPDDAWSRTGRGKQSVARALAVAFGSAFASVFAGTDYEHELRKTREEVIAGLTAQHRRFLLNIERKIHVMAPSADVLREHAHVLNLAMEAVLRQRKVRLRYRRFSGLEEQLEVRPYSLMVHDGRLYVVGSGSETRYYPYRLARVLELELTGEHFDYPTEYNPTRVFRYSMGVFVDPEPCRVVVRLDESWRTYALHHEWHWTQDVEVEEAGSVLVRLDVRPCAELEQWVLRFGEHAEVLEPDQLRRRIAKRLTEAARRYGYADQGA